MFYDLPLRPVSQSLSHSVSPSKGFIDMSSPLFYILAPFGLAFVLFAVFLVVSLFLKDPARPFRMFAAPPLKKKGDDEENDNKVVEEKDY